MISFKDSEKVRDLKANPPKPKLDFYFNITSQGRPPLVTINGKRLAVICCDYSWVTNSETLGRNVICVTGFLEGEYEKTLTYTIDVNTGLVTGGDDD